MNTINGHYKKIDNLDDAFKAAVDEFAKRAEIDSALIGAKDEIEINGHTYAIEIRYKGGQANEV